MEPAQPAILVVEDQATIRWFIGRALRRRGFQVLEAANAEEGLSIFQGRQGSIDLAILDIVMTGMSGLDLAAELIRERPLLKILYISGYADSVAMETLGRMSPEAVLAKPFTSRVLMKRVEHLLRGRVARAPGSDA